jgi:hypothetical protein
MIIMSLPAAGLETLIAAAILTQIVALQLLVQLRSTHQ